MLGSALFAIGAPVARANGALPTAARILVTGCTLRANERALQDQVRIELLAAGVNSVRSIELYDDNLVLEDEPSSLATLRIAFPDCENTSAEIRLGIADRKTGWHIERTLLLSDVPTAMQARATALALTELLRAEWPKRAKVVVPVAQASDSERAPPPAKLRASEVVAEDAERTRRDLEIARKLRLEWFAVGHVYSQTDAGDLSTSLAISKLITTRGRLQFGGTLSGGGAQGTDARLFQATNRIMLALVSRGLRPAIEVGVLFEAGWASLNGQRDGHHKGGIIMANAHATLRIPVTEGVETLITLQAGYVLMPMTAHAQGDPNGQLIGYKGPIIGLGAGLASWL